MPEARLVGLHWLHPAKPSAQHLCFGKGLLPGPAGGWRMRLLPQRHRLPRAPARRQTGARCFPRRGPSSRHLLGRNSPEPAPRRRQPHALLASPAGRGVAEGERGRHATPGGSAGAPAGTAVQGGREPGHPSSHEHQSPPKRPVPWPARLSPVLCPGEPGRFAGQRGPPPRQPVLKRQFPSGYSRLWEAEPTPDRPSQSLQTGPHPFMLESKFGDAAAHPITSSPRHLRGRLGSFFPLQGLAGFCSGETCRSPARRKPPVPCQPSPPHAREPGSRPQRPLLGDAAGTGTAEFHDGKCRSSVNAFSTAGNVISKYLHLEKLSSRCSPSPVQPIV